MRESLYFVFRFEQQLYGIHSESVEEVFLLPEFTVAPEAPGGVVGVVNLRGEPLPLIHLNAPLNSPLTDYRLTDKVIVLRDSGYRLGVIVHDILDPIAVAPGEIEPQDLQDQESTVEIQGKMTAGWVFKSEAVRILKDLKDWEAIADDQLELSNEADSSKTDSSETFMFAPNATAQERKIFRDRAGSLKQLLQQQQEQKPVAVVRLEGSVWGIDLEFVREFIDVRSLAPVPCCPEHIVGNTNYRGTLLTLIDVRKVLNLPSSVSFDRLRTIVIEVEEVMAGILVDEVYDAMFLLDSQNCEDPAPLMQNEYVQSTTRYERQTMSLLNLPKLLLSPELLVDEAVK